VTNECGFQRGKLEESDANLMIVKGELRKSERMKNFIKKFFKGKRIEEKIFIFLKGESQGENKPSRNIKEVFM